MVLWICYTGMVGPSKNATIILVRVATFCQIAPKLDCWLFFTRCLKSATALGMLFQQRLVPVYGVRRRLGLKITLLDFSNIAENMEKLFMSPIACNGLRSVKNSAKGRKIRDNFHFPCK